MVCIIGAKEGCEKLFPKDIGNTLVKGPTMTVVVKDREVKPPASGSSTTWEARLREYNCLENTIGSGFGVAKKKKKEKKK